MRVVLTTTHGLLAVSTLLATTMTMTMTTTTAFMDIQNAARARALSPSFSTTKLFYGRSLPPLPPTPLPPTPPPPDDVLTSLMKTFQSLQLPQLDMPQLPQFPSQLPSLDLPKFDLPQFNMEQLPTLLNDLLPKNIDWNGIGGGAPLQGFNFNLEQAIQSMNMENLDLSVVLVPLVQVQQVLTTWQPLVQDNYPDLMPFYQSIMTLLRQALESPIAAPAVILGATATLVVVVQTLLNRGNNSDMDNGPPPSQPYPTGKYNPVTAKNYFDRRPLLVATRGLQVVTRSLVFGLGFLIDYYIRGNVIGLPALTEADWERRGQGLAQLLCQLGSTYIKVGQSLSIRTDILSPPYIRGLQTLQDQVPPFDSAIAFDMMQDEWGGRRITDIVSNITPLPVASASLGQVYKATLKETGSTNGDIIIPPREVAIKVQRPNIMEQIALDMYLLREFIAPAAKTVGNLNSDTVGTVDAWGLGFVDELNYIQEAKNAQFFNTAIQQTPLCNVVFAPAVVAEHSTNKVLMTEWVNGERLDKSSQEDVTTLCSIAMNTYLTMLLEIGMLHCDPHPGNLLRTTDGKLAVLDWGMITLLDKDLQLTLIEHMAHLTSADYEEIPRDLLLLGFIPQDKANLINDSGVVNVLAGIYGAWTAGGGVAAFNVNDVINELQDLTSKKGNLFQIPPYFAYIAKSFSVLEGIGLTNDPKYSIINECMPYVSKRLLTDSTSMKSALNTFIFGPEKNNKSRIVDYKRVEQLVTGFGNYTTSASGALLGKDKTTLSRTQVLEDVADQILNLVFTEEETPLQEILLEQMAKITAASSRSIWTELRERSGTLANGRSVLGTLVDPLGFWRTSPLVRMNDLDTKTVETTRKLLALVQSQTQSSRSSSSTTSTTASTTTTGGAANNNIVDLDLSNLSSDEVIEVSSMLVRKVWNKRRGVLQTGSRFAQKLLELTADKLERGERDFTASMSSLDTPFANPVESHVEIPSKLEDKTFKSDKPVRTTPRVEIAREKQRLNIPPQGMDELPRTTVPVSSRLSDARQRLNRLQSDE